MSAALLVRLIFWGWLAAAGYIGHRLLLQQMPAVLLPAMALMLTVIVFRACTQFARLRAWTDARETRTLVLLHLLRLTGIGYLVLQGRGELSSGFAMSAGLGDIALAAFALPVALAPLDAALRQRALVIWNIAGVTSTLLVLTGMLRLGFTDPAQLAPFVRLPFSLWPTLLIPLLLASHLLIFVRLSRSE